MSDCCVFSVFLTPRFLSLNLCETSVSLCLCGETHFTMISCYNKVCAYPLLVVALKEFKREISDDKVVADVACFVGGGSGRGADRWCVL